MRPRLAPLINNPQPSPRSIGATAIGTVRTGGIAIMGTTGRIGAAGLGIGRIALTGSTVHIAFTGITAGIGAPTAIGVTGAAGNR